MARYHIHEGSYDLPASFRDESVIIHSIGEPRGPAQYGLVMTRASLDEGEDLFNFAERQLAELDRSLPGLTVKDRRQREVDGELALEAEYTWSADRGTMHQRQVYLPAKDCVLVITASALGAIPSEHDTELDALLASFRLRREG